MGRERKYKEKLDKFVGVKFTEGQKRELESMANEKNISLGSLIREIVLDQIDPSKKIEQYEKELEKLEGKMESIKERKKRAEKIREEKEKALLSYKDKIFEGLFQYYERMDFNLGKYQIDYLTNDFFDNDTPENMNLDLSEIKVNKRDELNDLIRDYRNIEGNKEEKREKIKDMVDKLIDYNILGKKGF